MEKVALFPPGESTQNILSSPTPRCPTTMIFLWSGMSGLRERMGEDPWLIGIIITFMMLNRVK